MAVQYTHRRHLLLLLLSLKADTHFTVSQSVEGWLQTEMVYPLVDSHPSKF